MRPVYALLNLVFFYTWKEISAYTPCQESMLTVRYVTSCPTDEVSWKERAGKMNCESRRQNCAMSLGLITQNHRFQYHCLINSHMNETLEVCALSRYILGFCAEFNTNGALVQENFDANCKQYNPPCPQYYHSAKAYRYQYCYELVYKQRKIQRGMTITTCQQATSPFPRSSSSSPYCSSLLGSSGWLFYAVLRMMYTQCII